MSDEETELNILRKRVVALENALAHLIEKRDDDIKNLTACDTVLDKHRKVQAAELTDAFERIIKLELSVFPHLSADIAELYRIIGEGDQQAFNRLDFRDRSRK